MQLYLVPSEGGAGLRKNTLGKNKFFGYQKERIIKCQQALWPEDDLKPLRPFLLYIGMNTESRGVSRPDHLHNQVLHIKLYIKVLGVLHHLLAMRPADIL